MKLNARKSRLKFIRRLLDKYPDLNIERVIKQVKSTENKLLPHIPYTYIDVYIPGEGNGRGQGQDDEDIKIMDVDEFIEIFGDYIQLPIKEKKFININTKKYGKDKKGRESQIDIETTLNNRLKTLIMMGKELNESILDELFEPPFYEDDIVYNIFSTQIEYTFVPLVTYNIDISGSVSPQERFVSKSLLILLMNYLVKNFDVSYIQLLLHSTQIYDFSIHKLTKNMNIRELIDKRKEIRDYLKQTEGGGTLFAPWVDFYKKYLERKPQLTKYLFYCSDFEVSNSEISYFNKNILKHPNLSYCVMLYFTGNVSLNRLVEEKINEITNNVPEDKYSLIVCNANLSVYDLILEISKYIPQNGVHII
ncbi:MAG: hypothetical protein ACO2OX_04485 [Candidatus Nanopusillus sp.]